MSDENTGAAPLGYKGIDPEVCAWSEQERERHRAWLAGPSERERAAVKAKLLAQAARTSDDATFDPLKVDAQVESWVNQERANRLAWAQQPEQRGHAEASLPDGAPAERTDFADMGARAFLTTDLALRGLWHRIVSYSLGYVDSLADEGRRSVGRLPLRRRVPY